MDRIYVKHQNKVPVHEMGLDKWRDVVVRNKRVRERLLTTLLDMIQKERTGEVIDRALMRSITMVSSHISDAHKFCLLLAAVLPLCVKTGHVNNDSGVLSPAL